jgi:hydroxyethylthiazole kinase-like uncharacterized protein yjeF
MTGPVDNAPPLWLEHWPELHPESHKYQRGPAALFAAPELTGATRLAAAAALRVGPGLVSVLAHERGDVYRATLSPEIMVSERTLEDLNGVSAVLAGPGGVAHRHLLELERNDLPKVVDSGALASPCGRLHYNAQTVLTPHAGEFARAFPEIAASSDSRERQALAAAAHSGAVLVLKGPVTFIVGPSGRVVRNGRPNPDLAVAGSGDVLAGIIVGLLAQGMAPFWAACAGVWLHSECGEKAGHGLIAGDLILALPAVLRSL